MVELGKHCMDRHMHMTMSGEAGRCVDGETEDTLCKEEASLVSSP